MIGDTLALVEHQFKGSRVQVEREWTGASPRVHGNSGKLQQVFLNLLLNAREAMPDGGILRIAGRGSDFWVRVEVSDSGHGIAPEHVQRIYDPFFTTKPAKAGNGDSLRGGTGLGLSVTYGIVQEHAGRISVESKPSRGTTFVLEFPRVHTRAAAPETLQVS